jgi:hypothetical protein
MTSWTKWSPSQTTSTASCDWSAGSTKNYNRFRPPSSPNKQNSSPRSNNLNKRKSPNCHQPWRQRWRSSPKNKKISTDTARRRNKSQISSHIKSAITPISSSQNSRTSTRIAPKTR